jgi:hypothetical protein
MALTALWSPTFYDTAGAMWRLAVMAMFYFIGREHDLKPAFLGFGVGMLIAYAIGPPMEMMSALWAGLFAPNSNSLGEAAALGAVGTLALPLGWLLTVPLLAIVYLADCRAAMLALGCAGVFWLWGKNKWIAAVVAIAATTAFVYMLHQHWHGGEAQRIVIYLDTLRQWNIFGHGVGSYYGLFPRGAVLFDTLASRPQHAHSELLQALFEGGIVGALLLTWLAVALLVRAHGSVEGLVFVTLCAIALVSFPLANPATLFLGALAAGRVADNRDSLQHISDESRMAVRSKKPVLSGRARQRHRGAMVVPL